MKVKNKQKQNFILLKTEFVFKCWKKTPKGVKGDLFYGMVCENIQDVAPTESLLQEIPSSGSCFIEGLREPFTGLPIEMEWLSYYFALHCSLGF